MQLIGNENLSVAQHKTEETHFDENSPVDSALKSAQYLGFTFYESGPAIRASFLVPAVAENASNYEEKT